MASSIPNLNHLAVLEGKLSAFIDRGHEDDGDDDDNAEDVDRVEDVVAILQDACTLVRETDGDAPDFNTIVNRVDQLINSAVDYSYNDGEICDFMPSFAHSEAYPELPGNIGHEEGVLMLSNHQQDVLSSLMTLMKGRYGDSFDPQLGGKMPKGPEPWSKLVKPHPLTTRLSRFWGNATISATSDQPLANVIYQARCEITSDAIPSPIALTISTNGTVLVANGMGGYKNREPALWYHFLEDTDDLPDGHHVQIGLSDIAYWTTTDEERKLMFAADRDRIKSYAWGSLSGSNYRHGLPTHTMDTGSYTGPLAVLSGGRLVRAGKGSVAVWNLDTLPTHGVKGKTRIGREISVEDSWRDDPEFIEMSSGSPSDATITLEDSNLSSVVWHPHPSIAGNMIIAYEPRKSSSYSCVSVDLEHDGKTVVKYLGHGGGVNVIATSPGDPNMFVSASDDGFARLFDVRRPLPVLTLKAGHPSGGCPAAVMTHPDGIPTVFTGVRTGQHIKMWDIRAQQAVYELSTGNNAVAGMAWDAVHNSLYAVTECHYMDRLGGNFGYRRARVPADQDPQDDELESDDEGYEGRCWPKKAFNGEKYFGYLFDAGEHRIFRFAFKESPDISVLPHYGQVLLDSNNPYW